ncbi:hypothetical protein GF407_02105 [candidate division KSB1 bacterium]|nr:hypothetical protein [candidate division KSB1 bacterium]
MKKIYLFSILFFIFSTGITPAQQKNAEEAQPKQQEDPETQQPQVDNGSIRLFLDKIEITGQLEKPQAVFIIPGSNPEIDDIQIGRSFFKKIFRSVEKKGRIINKPALEQKKRHDYIPW